MAQHSADPALATATDITGIITQIVHGGDASSQSACASFMVAYSAHPASWSTFPAIVAGGGSSAVRFFAANGLYWKVRTDWPSLPAGARDALLGQLWGALEGAAGAAASDVPVLRRQCLALGAAAVQTRGALAPLFSRVASLASRVLSGGGGGGGDGGALQLLACAEALGAVVEMAEELSGVPAGLRGELRRDAAAAAGAVRDLLLAGVAGGGSPANVGAAAAACAAATAPDGASPLPAAALASLLRCARVWSSSFTAGAAFSAACIAGDAPLLRAAVDALAALPGAAGGEAAGLFTGVFKSLQASAAAGAAGVTAAEKARALTSVGTALLLRSPALAAAVASGGGAGGAVGYWAEALAAVCGEAEWLCGEGSVAQPAELSALPLGGFLFALAAADVDPATGAPRAAVGGAPLGVGCLLADCALQCAAASPPPHVAVSALEKVDILTVASRHPFFRGPAQTALVQIVAAQCVDARAGVCRPDADSWQAYRTELDPLFAAASLLGGAAYVRALLALLPAPGSPGGVHGALAAALPRHAWAVGVPEWARVEAVLHCLAMTPESALREAVEAGTFAVGPVGGGNPLSFPLAAAGGSPAGGGARSPGHAAAATHGGPLVEVLLALLLRIVSQPPAALAPELVTSALQLLRVAASVMDAESAIPGAAALVAADAVFWPSGAPPVHTCMRDVVEAVAHFCCAGLRGGGGGGASPWWRGGGAGRAAPAVSTAAALEAAAATAAESFGSSCVAGDGGAGRAAAAFFQGRLETSGGDAGEGGEEEDGGWLAGAERASFTVGSSCARTLSRLLRSFGRSSANSSAYLWPEKYLMPLVAAWEEASGAGGVLSHHARATLLRDLVRLAMLLGKGERESALRRVLALPLARLHGVLSGASASPPGAPLPPDAEMIVSTELALLGSLLVDLTASEGSKGAPSRSRSASGESLTEGGESGGAFGGGGWAGGAGGGWGVGPGGGGFGATPLPAPPDNHPLLWLGEALWPALDGLLPRLSAGAGAGRATAAGALSVALAWTCHALRCFPPLLPARLAPTISSAAALYGASRAPQALLVVSWALMAFLPSDGLASAAAAAAAAAGSGLSPELTASCGALLSSLVGTTFAAAGAAAAAGWRGGMDPPPVSAEFFDVCKAALKVCPAVLYAPLPPSAPAPPPFSSLMGVCLALLEAAFRDSDGRAARAGVGFLKDVLSLPAMGTAAGGAVREAAGALGAAVAAGLTATEGDNVSHSAIECLSALLRSAAAMEVVAAVGAGVEAAAGAAAAALLGTTSDVEERARIAQAAAAGAAMEENGVLSLSSAERRTVVTGAAAGLHGGSEQVVKRMEALLKTFARLCRRCSDKDALQGYMM
jgi:hypothetical protein